MKKPIVATMILFSFMSVPASAELNDSSMEGTFCPITKSVEEQMIRERLGGESINSTRNALHLIMPEAERIERTGNSDRFSILETRALNYLDEKMQEANNEIDGRRYSRVEISPPAIVKLNVLDSEGNAAIESVSYPGSIKYITIDGKQPQLTIVPSYTTLNGEGGSRQASVIDYEVSSSLEGEELNSLLESSSSLSNFYADIIERKPASDPVPNIESFSIVQNLTSGRPGDEQFSVRLNLSDGGVVLGTLEGTFDQFDSACGRKFNRSPRLPVDQFADDREEGRPDIENGHDEGEAGATQAEALN